MAVALGFQTVPVGAAVVGQLDPCPAIGGQGILTTTFPIVPSPSYRVANPVALSVIQKGLAVPENVTPHAFF